MLTHLSGQITGYFRPNNETESGLTENGRDQRKSDKDLTDPDDYRRLKSRTK